MTKKHQKGIALNSTIIGITIILILLVGAFYFQKKRTQNPLSPEEVVKVFYSDYFNFLKEGKKVDEMNYKNSSYLTKDFKNKINEFFDSPNYSEGNPFICTQDFFEKDYELKIIDSSEEKTTIMVDNYSEIILSLINGIWLIDGIDCHSEEITEETSSDTENQIENNFSEESEEIVIVEEETINLYDELTPDVKKFANRAIANLAQRLSISTENIKVVGVTATLFSDHTLGTSLPGEVYPQIPVSGYVILLNAEGINYKYHLSETNVILVNDML